MIRAAIAASMALVLAGCANGPDPKTAAAAHPEARAYAVTSDAMDDVDAALARAAAKGKRVLVVFGANWCHDSRALAGWLETPRFAALIAERYEVVFVNVGMPQTGDGHNLEVAQRFGLADVPGTPALLVLTADGQPVNADTAAGWRNAASRSEDAIFAELAELAGQHERDTTDVSVWIASDMDQCRFALSQDGPWGNAMPDLNRVNGGAKIHVRAVEGTDWKCVAGGIYQLQQLGLSVGFVSDPAN